MPSLSSLNLPSLSNTVLSFFSHLGILSVEDFLLQDTYSLVALAEQQLSANQYKQAVADILLFLEENTAAWVDGVDLFNQMQQTVSILPLGCRSLDELLQGGIRDGMVTELVGPSSSGKTQICIQAAASAILHGVMVAYIDTCNSFSSSRLAEVIGGLSDSGNFQCERDLENSLKLLLCYRVHDVFSLLALLEKIDLDFSTRLQGCEQVGDLRNVRLIIVDSVSSLLTPVLSSIYVQGHALMMNCGQVLRKLAVQNNISAMITNHTVGGADGMAKPALGESWKGIAHVRMSLFRNPDTGMCTASLIKHSSMGCNKKVYFQLKKAGVQSL